MENQALTDENTEPKYSRRSRSADQRESNGRAASERAPIVFGNVSRYNLDPSVLADRRYQFAWTPYVIANDEVHEKFDLAIERGWECVETTDYPTLRRTYKHDPFRKRESEDVTLKVGGQICMRRDVEIMEAEQKHFDEENFHRDQLVKVHQLDAPGGTRVFSQSRTKSAVAKF